MSKGLKIALGTCVLVPPIIFMLVGIEIVSYWTIPLAPMRVEGDPLISYDREIGFVPRPNSQTRRTDLGPTGKIIVDYHVYTDQRGARVSSAGDKTPDHADVVTIGDSFTWGHGVENQETFAFQVFHRLHVTGANLAMGSYGTTQSLQMLHRNRDLAPRLVIYSFITDHLVRNIDPCARSYYPFCFDYSHVAWDEGNRPAIAPPRGNGTTRVQRQARAAKEGLDPATWLVHGIDVAISRVTFRLSRKAASDPTKQETALDYLLEQLALTADAVGGTLLVVYIPSDRTTSPPPEVLSRAAARIRFRFLDLSQAFRHYHEVAGNPPLFIPNDGHPSVAGHALIAEKIVSFVNREGLMGRR